MHIGYSFYSCRMDLVEGFGKSKKNMKAYILLTPDSIKALEVLTTYRTAVGVPPMNKYMFARLNANTPLSGTTAMKELLGKCEGLKSPESITSTSLRKYIATVSQVSTKHLLSTNYIRQFLLLFYLSISLRFLGHLSHPGDLLLWVGVRHSATSVVR